MIHESGTTTLAMPVALFDATLLFITGSPEERLFLIILESFHYNREIAAVKKSLPLPPQMMHNLILEAQDKGYLIYKNGELELHPEIKTYIENDQLEKYLGIDYQEAKITFVIGQIAGKIHPLRWVINRTEPQNISGRLEERIKAEHLKEIAQAIPLKQFAITEQYQILENLPTNFAANTHELVKRVYRIKNITFKERKDIYIPLGEHITSDSIRLLVKENVPPSIISAINIAAPEIFSLQYNLDQQREGWKPNKYLALYEKMEHLYREVQWATWPSTSNMMRRELWEKSNETLTLEQRNWKESDTPLSDVEHIEAIIGPAYIQGEAFQRIVQNTEKWLIATTSFLNPKYAEWLGDLLSTTRDKIDLIILYGHANDEDSEQQKKTMNEYYQAIPEDLKERLKITIISTKVRSHEKIIVNDKSMNLVGSWNPCSSIPDSTYLEGSVLIISKETTQRLLIHLKKELDNEHQQIIDDKIDTLMKTEGKTGPNISKRMEALGSMLMSMQDLGDFSRKSFRKLRNQMFGLYEDLWEWLSSPRIRIIPGDVMRDVLFEQVSIANESIMITTDRITSSGLDSSLLQKLIENKKQIDIVWGREHPKWDLSDKKEEKEQVEEASEIIKTILSDKNHDIKTSDKPMQNHSKIMVIDSNRSIFSSDNYLAHGYEADEQSSWEIGIMVESPLIARETLGKIYLHSPGLGRIFKFTPGKFPKIPWDLTEITRQEINKLWEIPRDELEHPEEWRIVTFAIESRFYEFNKEGELKRDKNGRPISIDKELSKRWEEVLREQGKGKTIIMNKEQLPEHLEGFYSLCQQHGMLHLHRVKPSHRFEIYPIDNHPKEPLRDSIESSKSGLTSLTLKIIRIMKELVEEEYSWIPEKKVIENSTIILKEIRKIDRAITDQQVLEFAEKSYLIIRNGQGDCRITKPAEKEALYRRRSTKDGKTLICVECGKEYKSKTKTITQFCPGCFTQRETDYRHKDMKIAGGPRQELEQKDTGEIGYKVKCATCDDEVYIQKPPLPGKTYYCKRHDLYNNIKPVDITENGRPLYIHKCVECGIEYKSLQKPRSNKKSLCKQHRIQYRSTCSECGIEITLPFEPKPGKNYYCKEHFNRR